MATETERGSGDSGIAPAPYSFTEQLKIGKVGEELVSLYLLRNGIVKTVLSRADDPEWQKRGIDFACIDVQGREVGVEVKTDGYTTGNFFFERCSCKERGVLGCFLTSAADYWVYYFSSWDCAYWFPLESVRDYVCARSSDWREVKTSTGRSGAVYTSSGWLVPIADVVRDVPGISRFDGVKASLLSSGGVPCPN